MNASDSPDAAEFSEALGAPQNADGAEPLTMDGPACLRMGNEAMFRGDKKPAMRWHSRAIDKEPSLIDAWISFIRQMLWDGDLQGAQTWIGRGLTLFPNEPALMALRAVNYARRGMLRQAINNSDAVLEQNPTHALAQAARGEVLLLADNKNAEFCFEQALKLTQPMDWKMPMMLGLLMEERRLWGRAIAFYEAAGERNKQQAVVWYRIGVCRAALGQPTLATRAYEQATAMCKADDPLLNRLRTAKSGSIFTRLARLFGLR